MGQTLVANRNGLIVQAAPTHADGRGERRAALDVIRCHSPGSTRRPTPGANNGDDSADFVAEPREASVTPDIARKARGSAIDGRTTRRDLSRKQRKKVEESFGWAETVGGMAQTVLRGVDRVRARCHPHDGGKQPRTIAEAARHMGPRPGGPDVPNDIRRRLRPMGNGDRPSRARSSAAC